VRSVVEEERGGGGICSEGGVGEEEGSGRRQKGEDWFIWCPGEGGEDVAGKEGHAGTGCEEDGFLFGEKREAVESVEEGAREKVVDCSPLHVAGH